MAYISLKFLLIFYLLKSVYGTKQCLAPGRGSAPAVSNGELVPNSYYPWHVSIHRKYRHINSDSTKYICGGSIISNDFILTVAHCLYEHDQLIINDRLFIRVGSNRREGGEYYGIYKTIIHKDFTTGNSRADIALLQTSNVIPFTRIVRPVCYSNIDFDDVNIDAWIPGWGLTENLTAGLSETLNHAKMPIRTRDDCEARDPKFYRDHVTDNSFCAGNLESTSLCFGDSGGGLVMNLSDYWYVRGIASTAARIASGAATACDLTKFVLFTDVVSYADWIDDNLKSQKNNSLIKPIGKSKIVTSKSEEECDKYMKEIPVVLQDKLANSDSSYRWVETAKEFPSHCFVQMISPQLEKPANVGSCTLISNRWVITSATFVNLYPPTHVLLGAHNLWNYNATNRLVAVEKTIIHQNFNPQISTHNIALVKLAEDVKFTDEIHPSCLYRDNKGPEVGTELIFTGMGIGSKFDSMLMQKNQKIFPTAECYYTHFSSLRSEIIEKQICTFGVTDCGCARDIGEGLHLLINAERRIFSLVGISTITRPECGANTPTGYIRVSSYLEWIEEHVWPD